MKNNIDLDALFTPSPLTFYNNLTNGGDYKVRLNQDEASVTLKVHDHGFDALTEEEKQIFYRVVHTLKDEIWP